MTTNPSHILIARNSRGPNNPSATLSSPTETHAAAAGIFRSSGSPPWLFEECETDEVVSELEVDSDDEAIEIDNTFTKNNAFPGTVKIVVESTTFWYATQYNGLSTNRLVLVRAHKEVLYFASPFFEAALSGDWAETGRPPSMSSVITISQPPSIPGEKRKNNIATDVTFSPLEADEDIEVIGEGDVSRPASDGSAPVSESENSDAEEARNQAKARARNDSLAKLQSKSSPTSEAKAVKKVAMVKRRPKNGPDAVIVLKEERVRISAFIQSQRPTLFRPPASMIFLNSFILSMYMYAIIHFL